MLKIMSFNWYRNLKNPVFISTLSLAFLAIFISFGVLVGLSNNDITTIITSTTAVIMLAWLTIICYINFIFISNAMILDSSSGLLNLELSKGYSYNELLMYKLLANKIVTIGFNAILLILMFLVLEIVQPINIDYFEKCTLIGYLSFFAFDWLTTGMFIFFCSFKKQRLVFYLISSITLLFTISTFTGNVQQQVVERKFPIIGFKKDFYLSDYYKKLEQLSYSRNGIVYSLMKNMYTLNQDYGYTLDVKNTASNSSCSSFGYECLYNKHSSEYNPDYTVLLGRYGYISYLGMMLDSEYFVNNSPTLSTNYKFKLIDQYKENIVYKFLTSTIKQSNSNNLNSTYYYKVSDKNISGPNQFDEYSNYLLQDSVTESLIKALNINESKDSIKQEIDELSQLLKKYFVNIWKTKLNHPYDEVIDLLEWWNFDHSLISNINLKFADEKDIYNNATLKDGNRLYMALLFELINNYMRAGSNGFGEDTNQLYNIIQKNPWEYRVWWISNPLYYPTYLMMYSNKNMSLAQEMISFKSNLWQTLSIRAVNFVKNENFIPVNYFNTNTGDDRFMYNKLENIYLKQVNISPRIVEPDFIYLGYILFGGFTGLIGFLIYRKISII
ncbi:hypothetical protein SHELI_v1c04770 [Spiroplasma helicoides]|uniref:Uncharacterized protein n=1 Tax=Spiroplasma helicoides TaxID=216938 RepID=A0A1B3SKH0_9MOLU|nr:ABC transporter permease [Spiroplasma helicoides]AOG60428.1 hypothetical protein SHELI_v1c04770 [Spiroplasma helicoides]